MRVLLAGGGTAGHTSPLLATADALRRLDPDVEITCLGTARGLETRVVPEAGYPLELIPPVPLPRKPNVDLLKVPARLRGAVRDTVRVLDRTGADVVVGFGGYVSMPAYLAARRRKVPIVLHEQNAVPGLANKAGARIARRVAVSFPDTPLPKAEYVGLPLRTMIARLDRDAMRAEARRFFDLDPDRPTLLVTGGSQGARRLNQAVSGASAALAGAGVQVLHVVGPQGEATPEPGDVPYAVVSFVDRMDLAYAAADLVLSPRRRQQRHRGRRGRAARHLRAVADRQRRAGAQRPSGGRRRGSAAGEGRGAHLGVGGRPRAVPGHRPDPAGGDGRRGVRARAARRRRAAGAHRPRGRRRR